MPKSKKRKTAKAKSGAPRSGDKPRKVDPPPRTVTVVSPKKQPVRLTFTFGGVLLALVNTIPAALIFGLLYVALGLPRVSITGQFASIVYIWSAILMPLCLFPSTFLGTLFGLGMTNAFRSLDAVRQERSEVLGSFLMSVFGTLAFAVFVQVIARATDTRPPGVGIWIIQGWIASSMAMAAAYRVHRRRLTMTADERHDFMVRHKDAHASRFRAVRVFRALLSKSTPSHGDLFMPVLQSLAVILVSFYVSLRFGEPHGDSYMVLVYVVSHTLLTCLWAVGIRGFDHINPRSHGLRRDQLAPIISAG